MKDDLELIDIETIIKEEIIPYKEETIRRYFRHEILYCHERSMGVGFLSYRGSVKVRYQTMLKIARKGSKRISSEEVSNLFTQASGPEDEFIVNKLEKNVPVEKILEEFVQKVRESKPTG